MDYHDRLRIYFKSLGLKQAEAGDRLGYGKSMFSQYLNSKEINMDFINKLVTEFPDVDLNYILKGEEKVYPGVNEAGAEYGNNPDKMLDQMEVIIGKLREELSRK